MYIHPQITQILGKRYLRNLWMGLRKRGERNCPALLSNDHNFSNLEVESDH